MTMMKLNSYSASAKIEIFTLCASAFPAGRGPALAHTGRLKATTSYEALVSYSPLQTKLASCPETLVELRLQISEWEELALRLVDFKSATEYDCRFPHDASFVSANLTSCYLSSMPYHTPLKLYVGDCTE